MTVKQVQCLLTYLGKDVGGIDGIQGRKTEQALAEIKAEYGVGPDGLVGIIAGTVPRLEKPGTVSTATGTFWDTVKWFSREEFRCKGSGCCNGFPVEPAEKLVRMLDDLRDFFGVPAIISSGIRCKTHNTAVKGVATSRHMKGWAADVSFKGIPPEKVLAKVQQHKSCAYAYIIQDGGKNTGYVHMDVIL